MSKPALPALILIALSLAGCNATADLAAAKHDEASGDLAAIEARSPPAACSSGAPTAECAQFHALRGRACMALAMQAAAPGAACPPPGETVRTRLDCAAEELSRIDAPADAIAADPRAGYHETQAQALYCAANLRPAAEGLPLAERASAVLDPLPRTARRDWLQASAQTYVAAQRTLSADQRCAAARRGAAFASRGLAQAPVELLAGGLRAAARDARDLASALPGCTVE